MLALTKKTDYALIALAHLSTRPDEVVSAREIARECGMTLPILTNILKMLAGAGMVASTRGACGGYGLAKSADEITLHDLITTIEGPFQFVQCALEGTESGKSPCGLEPSCPIRSPAFKIYGRMKELLESITLAELLGDSLFPVGTQPETAESIGAQRIAAKECAR